MMQYNYSLVIFILVTLTLTFFTLSLLIGPVDISFSDAMAALFADSRQPIAVIMWEIRLPRAILGLLIGIALGMAGAVLQGYLRNPLADPSILGISASASLGAVICIYTGFSASVAVAMPLLAQIMLPLMAMTGAFIAAFFIQSLAGRYGSPLTVILAGIAVATLAGAFTSLVINLSPNPFATVEIVFWMMGSLTDRSMTHVALAVPFIIVGCLLLASVGRSLDLLTLGNDTAASMGINLRHLQFIIVIGVASAVGASTAVSGAIGFIGLIIPHVLRPLCSYQPSKLILASGLGGAVLLLVADILVRFIDSLRDIKIGVLTAMIGAPLFFWLIIKTRREML